MKVIYSLSTAPYYAKNPHGDFALERFELYTAAISSLVRRKAGDTTIMHCDSRGAKYLDKMGLNGLWSEVKTTIPDDLDGINPQMFWAAGKLFALARETCPLLMLDTDFIAWHLPQLECLTAAHREDLSLKIYPPVGTFKMKSDYKFTPMNSARPLNTAFLYLPDEDFKRLYVESSMSFMKSAIDCDDGLAYMVFAEQRLLAILAEHERIETRTILDIRDLHNQESYTHLWGAKRVMRKNPAAMERFCEKCRMRIRKDFPEWEHIM